jgi:hypothetical protein
MASNDHSGVQDCKQALDVKGTSPLSAQSGLRYADETSAIAFIDTADGPSARTMG